MSLAPYRLTDPPGSGATFGLVVLQTDETIEGDFRRLCARPDIALHVTRIPFDPDVTPATLARMATALPAAASLLPPGLRFDSVGYGCTSGATMIGPSRVAELLRGSLETRSVADPLSAARAALAHLVARRIGVVSPYVEAVAGPLCRALGAGGVEVAHTVSFGEVSDARVARIDPASIREAALAIGAGRDLDAVFISCTNLRTLDIVDELEARLAVPVVGSNLALAWQMFRAARTAPVAAPGRLFEGLNAARA